MVVVGNKMMLHSGVNWKRGALLRLEEKHLPNDSVWEEMVVACDSDKSTQNISPISE